MVENLSAILYTGLIALTGVERVVELVVSKRNARWSFERGGTEYGAGHYPVMAMLHTGFLLGCVAEVWLLGRGFTPWVGWPMLAIALLCQAGRWHIISKLGHHWNTRVIVVPGMERVDTGIYAHLRHPNYVIVAIEGVALPLIHNAWISAAVFTILNAALLSVRIRVEEEALQSASADPEETT